MALYEGLSQVTSCLFATSQKAFFFGKKHLELVAMQTAHYVSPIFESVQSKLPKHLCDRAFLCGAVVTGGFLHLNHAKHNRLERRLNQVIKLAKRSLRDPSLSERKKAKCHALIQDVEALLPNRGSN